MKYELIGKNDFSLNPLETVLNNRGIVNTKEFLNVSAKHIISHTKLNNINKATETIIRHIEKGGELFVQVDSDP